MDRATVHNALRSMWALLYEAEQRPLREAELIELARLLAIVENGVVAVPCFSLEADAFCLSVRSSGLFENASTPCGLPHLRARIDDLTAVLTSAGPGDSAPLAPV